MKRMLTMLVAGLSLAVPQLQADASSGFYIGAGAGSTVYADDELMWDTWHDDQDDEDSGHKFYAGYQINKIVGIELSYVDYGTFKAYDGLDVYKQEFKATHLAANVGYSFAEGQFRPFALVGVGHIDHDETGSLGLVEDDVSSHSFYLGFGFQYEPAALQGIGMRVGYDIDIFDRDVYDGIWHYEYTQGVGLWYLALQYRF